MRAAAMTLFAAATLATASTHADPSLPAGWIAGGPRTPMTADSVPSARSRQALQLASSPLREVIAPAAIALDAIETVAIEPAPTEAEIEASNADVPGEAPPELFVDRGCERASVTGHAFGTIQVGWVGQPIAPQSGGGASLYHVRGSRGLGDGKHLYTRAMWETVDRLPDGTLRFTETVARFHVHTCKAKKARRYTAIARPIFDGLAFVFRTRCDRCSAPSRDDLHVILPAEDWGAETYSHRVVHLAGDGADALRVRVSRLRAQKFANALSPRAPAPPVDMRRLIGIEVVKGLGEAAPSVIGYAADVRHVGF